MSKNTYYMRQCKLEKQIEGGTKQTVTWMHEKFAIMGAFIKLKDRDTGVWTDGWKVTEVSSNHLSYEMCNQKSQEHTKMATYKNK
jgi:hypothetical protein